LLGLLDRQEYEHLSDEAAQPLVVAGRARRAGAIDGRLAARRAGNGMVVAAVYVTCDARLATA
jgi:hypothetical protein